VIDSGDLYDLSVKARKMLDEAGLDYVQILVMSDLDEYKIKKMQDMKAPVDIYGAATEVLNVTDAPKLEVVYKLSELQEKNKIIPKMKLSTKKLSLPGKKQVFRIKKDKYLCDIIGLDNEEVKDSRKLLCPVIKNGKLAGALPDIETIHSYYKRDIENFPTSLLDIENKYQYEVKISKNLQKLIEKTRSEIIKNHS